MSILMTRSSHKYILHYVRLKKLTDVYRLFSYVCKFLLEDYWVYDCRSVLDIQVEGGHEELEKQIKGNLIS